MNALFPWAVRVAPLRPAVTAHRCLVSGLSATLLFLFPFSGVAQQAASGVEAVPTLVGEIGLVIGDAFGPVESSFGKVSGTVGDAKGRIYVADSQASEVRAFSPDGGFLFTVARAGQGPAEVFGPCCLAFSPDGLLWVRDAGNARYGAYLLEDAGAASVTTVRMSHGHGGMWASLSFAGDTLVDIGGKTVPDTGVVVRRYFVIPGEGVVREERGNPPTRRELGDREVRTSVGLLYFQAPFGARYLTAHGPGGVWAETVTWDGEVLLHRPGGRTVPVRTGIDQGPLVSRSERQAAEEEILRQRRRARERAGEIEWDVPQRKQPVEALFFDTEGRLWVQRSVAEGRDNEALVYTAQGRLVERRVWPAGVRLDTVGWAGGTWSLGVTRDQFDAESVVRIDWARR